MARRGRPRSFDRDQALQRVMEVFWEKGYEGAQLNDLVAAIGIAPPSFYAAFGSKETAFREAVDLYIATIGSNLRCALDEGETVKDGLRAMFLASIDVALSSTTGGCLLILGLVNCLPENEAARDHLLAARRKTAQIISARLERGIRDGDLQPDAKVEDLANFFHGVVQAISFQARDGSGRQRLEALIEPALATLG